MKKNILSEKELIILSEWFNFQPDNLQIRKSFSINEQEVDAALDEYLRIKNLYNKNQANKAEYDKAMKNLDEIEEKNWIDKDSILKKNGLFPRMG